MMVLRLQAVLEDDCGASAVASQGHAEHAEHAEEFDKKTKNTPKIEVFGNFPPFLPQFGQNTPDFLTFLPSCDAPVHNPFG